MSVGEIFADAQKSTINHKSLAKRLHRLQIKHANNSSRFEEQVKDCIYRCLEVAKSEAAGRNVVKFLTTYCVAAQDVEEQTEEQNITSEILMTLLPFMCAKDKTIRYRATQIVAQILGVLEAIEDDLYQAVRHELVKRLRDRVPAIRLEAVCALGRLVENEMDEEAQAAEGKETEDEDTMMSDEAESSGLLEKLLDVLQNDTNADVRRALLLNLPVTHTTLPYLLERARDRDGPTRRILYARLIPKLGDFRHLSLSMREKLLRWGLRDRDEKVRKATARMFSTLWIEQCAGTMKEAEQEEQDPKPEKHIGFYEPMIPALLELLERIDILNAGNEDGIGLEAMREFWVARPDYFDAVTFEDEFWNDLTVESAFMARTFYDHCQQNRDAQSKAEDKMPEVTRFGFHLQMHINKFIDMLRDTNEGVSSDDDPAEQEFIVEQLLHISHTLDYTDEIGRRKMFSLLRQTLSMADLPEESTRLVIESLRLVCNSDAAGEKEFIAVVLEAMAEVHDAVNPSDVEGEANGTEEDSFVSARSEVSHDSNGTSTPSSSNPQLKRKPQLSAVEQEAKQLHELTVNLKCLHISQVMLQNISGGLTSNVQLETMLNTLIIPCVRSHEAPLREKALECLGLCCLLAPDLARENHGVFALCLKSGHAAIKELSLKVLCDVLLAHRPTPESDRVDIAPFVRAFAYAPDVQLVATASLAKLMLCGFYRGADVEAFDYAVDEAEKMDVKGWELLAKVKAAVRTTETVGAEEEL